MRLQAHLAFGLVALAATAGGGWLWSQWGAAALLNRFATICG